MQIYVKTTNFVSDGAFSPPDEFTVSLSRSRDPVKVPVWSVLDYTASGCLAVCDGDQLLRD